jgi:hypothetical protein
MMWQTVMATVPFKAVPACGEADSDNPAYHWTPIAVVSLDSPFLKDKGLLCLGADDKGIPQQVIYRQTDGGRTFTFEELRQGRKVILHSDDLRVNVIRKGALISLNVPSVGIQDEEQHFSLELRFVRNLARIGHADRRVWRPAMAYHHRLGTMRSLGEHRFDELQLLINTTAVIKSINLFEQGKLTKEMATNRMDEVDEL